MSVSFLRWKVGSWLMPGVLLIGLFSCRLLDQERNYDFPLKLWFFNVGHGNAALLSSQDGQMTLIDTGNDSARLISSLREKGISGIGTLIITHADLDHYGALEALIAHISVERVILPNDSSESESWNRALSCIRQADILQQKAGFGDTVFVGEGSRLRVLWPIKSSHFTGNNQSYVLKLNHGLSSVLFTGDIEEDAEYELMKIGTDLSCNIFQVAHHGSGSSSSLPFLSAVAPRWAVISCDSSVYGHPHPQTEAALRLVLGSADRLIRTDRNGEVEFKINGEEVRLEIGDKKEERRNES